MPMQRWIFQKWKFQMHFITGMSWVFCFDLIRINGLFPYGCITGVTSRRPIYQNRLEMILRKEGNKTWECGFVNAHSNKKLLRKPLCEIERLMLNCSYSLLLFLLLSISYYIQVIVKTNRTLSQIPYVTALTSGPSSRMALEYARYFIPIGNEICEFVSFSTRFRPNSSYFHIHAKANWVKTRYEVK